MLQFKKLSLVVSQEKLLDKFQYQLVLLVSVSVSGKRTSGVILSLAHGPNIQILHRYCLTWPNIDIH